MTTWISSTHNIYSLQLPTWLNKAGISKGIYHDKQSLGVILEPGTTIRIKHLNPANEPPLELSLLNDDGSKENYIPFKSELFSEFTVTYRSVPFVSTPYRDTPSNIEIVIEYSTTPATLPLHIADTDTAAFFKLWDEQASAFALISTRYADILVPAKDKTHLKQLHEGFDLANLDLYYQTIFELYNQLAGLAYSPDRPTNKNIPNRYFLKANRTGRGTAYYGHTHTAETNDTIASFWLNPYPQNWGSIHEIAHGYEGAFMGYSEIPLGEVWNNLYAYYYQVQYLGIDLFKDSWLYHGQPEQHFDATEQLFERNTPVNTWAQHQCLYYLILIFDKAGLGALTAFNKNYRALCNQHDFTPRDHSFIEAIIDSCAKTSNIDISPLLRIGQLSTSRTSNLVSRYSNRKPVYPLYKLVPEEKLATTIKQLSLASRIDLVDSITLKGVGLMGNIELTLDKKLFEEFHNRDFLLRNGSNLSTIININSQTIKTPNLPSGVYTLQAPSTGNGKLYISTQHIDVRADTTNNIDVEYDYIPGVKLASQTIILNGLYGQFGLIEVDSGKDCITLIVNATPPHVYFSGRLYASITVRDRHQRIVFQQELMGDSVLSIKEKISASSDYTIDIFHAEPGRNVITPASESVLDPNNTFITLTTTSQGLTNKQLGTSTGDNLAREIEKLSTIIKSQPHAFLYRDHPLLDDFYVAINSFNDIEHRQLLEKYKDMYVIHQNIEPRTITGKSFGWLQAGLGGQYIMNTVIDTIQETIDVEVFPNTPHIYFENIYTTIWIHNKNGNILFCQELRGNVLSEHTLFNAPFSEGSELSIYHAEPSRCPIINQESKEQYQVMSRHRVRALGSSRLEI